MWEESISFKDSEAGSVPFNLGNCNLPLILNLKYCDIFKSCTSTAPVVGLYSDPKRFWCAARARTQAWDPCWVLLHFPLHTCVNGFIKQRQGSLRTSFCFVFSTKQGVLFRNPLSRCHVPSVSSNFLTPLSFHSLLVQWVLIRLAVCLVSSHD